MKRMQVPKKGRCKFCRRVRNTAVRIIRKLKGVRRGSKG